MAANKAQGKSFGLFLVGITTACAGLAYIGSGGGKVAAIVGVVLLLASFATAIKLKPLEGTPALKSQPAGQKIIGLALAVAGWVIAAAGVNVVAADGARLGVVIVGIIVSLVGIIGVLPAACNKNAIWKA